jgi:hypothetical protein
MPPFPLSAQGARLLVPLPELEARVSRDSLDPMVHYDVALGYWVGRRFDDAERALRRAVGWPRRTWPSRTCRLPAAPSSGKKRTTGVEALQQLAQLEQ